MRSFRLFLLVVLFATSLARAADLTEGYSPTRAEWLKLALAAGIYEQSNLWRERVAVVVVVNSKDNTASISVTLANGAPDPSSAAKERYAQSIRSIASEVLSRYSWASGVKLMVQFV